MFFYNWIDDKFYQINNYEINGCLHHQNKANPERINKQVINDFACRLCYKFRSDCKINKDSNKDYWINIHPDKENSFNNFILFLMKDREEIFNRPPEFFYKVDLNNSKKCNAYKKTNYYPHRRLLFFISSKEYSQIKVNQL